MEWPRVDSSVDFLHHYYRSGHVTPPPAGTDTIRRVKRDFNQSLAILLFCGSELCEHHDGMAS